MTTVQSASVQSASVQSATAQSASDPEVGSAIDRALTRISVRPPYFAIEELEELGPGIVRALVPATAPTKPEVGVMKAAQVARHLAILGSCGAALARDDDARHHYLAVKAHYTRAAGAPTEPIVGPLVAEAVSSWLDKRTARSIMTLQTQDGRATHMLDVTYAVMTPRMFGRLHPDLEDGANDDGSDSDAANQLESGLVVATDTGVRMDCGPIPEASCAGHFPGTPAAPVALVMGQLCETAAHALAHHLGKDVSYSIEEGHVTASKLARASQHLVLEAAYIEPVGPLHRLSGVAKADGEVIGEVDVVLSTPVLSTPELGRP